MVSRHGFHIASATRMTMITANAIRMIESARRDGSNRRAFAMRAILPSRPIQRSTPWMRTGRPPDHGSVRDPVLDELGSADLESEPLVEPREVGLRVQLVG